MKRNLAVLIILLLLTICIKSQESLSKPETEELKALSVKVVSLFQAAKYGEALPIAKEAVELAEKAFGENSVETARAAGNLGYLYKSLNDEKKSEKELERSARIFKNIQSLEKKDGEVLAGILENLAISKEKKDFVWAENNLEDAIAWREKVSGVEAKQLAPTYFLLANINYWKKDYKKSSLRYRKVLELIEKHRNVDQDSYQVAYYSCRCAFIKMGDTEALADLREKFYSNPNSDLSSLIKGTDSGVVNGKALNLMKPSYPEEARKAGAEGAVQVEVFINKEGKVISACGKNKAHESLIRASEISALNSKFSPTTISGQPVNVTGVIIYNFTRR